MLKRVYLIGHGLPMIGVCGTTCNHNEYRVHGGTTTPSTTTTCLGLVSHKTFIVTLIGVRTIR